MKIKVNDLAVYLEGDKNNPAVIFVHAFPHDRRMWRKQVDFLAKEFYVATYDVRGFGESEIGDGQYTMEQYADDLINLVDTIGLDKPMVCGLSMGGYIIFRALEKAEEKFSAAVLMDTRTEADDNAGKLKRAAAIKEINEKGLRPFAENFVKNCVAEKSIEDENPGYEKALEIATSQNPAGVKGALLAMVSRTDTTENLAKIKIPVAVICGEHDALTPPESMKKIAETIPDAEFHLIENAGHLSNLEQPNAVNKALYDFAKKIFN
jgi:pimeloyl-ACP methyl ester carboxylesterase